MPESETFKYVDAVCGLEDHEECTAACEVDPISLEDIPPENVLRLIVYDRAVCYDIESLYEWLLTRNREPTTQQVFSATQLQYITNRYRVFTGKHDAHDLSVTGMADIFIIWLEQHAIWKSAIISEPDPTATSLDIALTTILNRIYTDDKWSRDAIEASFSHEQVRFNRVTMKNLSNYIADAEVVDQIFNVLYKHMVEAHEAIGGVVHGCMEAIHQSLSNYIESESQAQMAMLIWGRYIECRTPSLRINNEQHVSPDVVSEWLNKNGYALNQGLTVELFEEFGDFSTLSNRECGPFVHQMNKLLLSLLDSLVGDDMKHFVWISSLDVLKQKLTI